MRNKYGFLDSSCNIAEFLHLNPWDGHLDIYSCDAYNITGQTISLVEMHLNKSP